MRVGNLICGSLWKLYLLSIYDFIQTNILQDPDLEGRLDKMEELDEFEPDEVNV